MMKIVIVAGGSGGHIYPALTLAKELINRGHKITFIGANDRMEKELIPSLGYDFIGLDTKTTRGGVLQKFNSMLSIAHSYNECLKILKNNCDLVIGFGNYISVPVVLAAKRLKIKVVLHEQNSFVGRANRFLDMKADMIIASYDESLKQFKNPNTYVLGNPQSSVALGIKEDKKVLSNLGLNPDMKTVVIFMGSLGSESIMNVMIDYFKLLENVDYQIIYATGKKHYAKVKNMHFNNVYIFDAINGIEVMANSDLLISRAGATTLSEITAIGMPSILIPSPYVPNNHQYHNAMALVKNDAAILLEEKNLNPQELKNMVDDLIHDDERLKVLSENARKMANDHVIENIIYRIDELWKQ